MDALGRNKVPSVLALLGGSLELAVALPETFYAPLQSNGVILTALAVLTILCAVMSYDHIRPTALWGLGLVGISLVVMIIGGPLEGFEILAPPLAFTGGILLLLAEMS